MTDGRDDIGSVGHTLADAERAVAFTGAGASAESGVPTFRGDGGVWSEYDERDFTFQRLRREPAAFWTDWLSLRGDLAGAYDPNPAHRALADLESAGHLHAVVTQNVDALHQAAGSEDVVGLHGSTARVACRDCGGAFDANPVLERARGGELPPECADCGGVLEPDAVLFGEPLPRDRLRRAEALADTCDVFLVVGSSLEVEPAASLPRRAARSGASLVVVNLDPTPVDDRADHVFRGKAGEVLPDLADAVTDW
jgi:NAD-dependent deacetylase